MPICPNCGSQQPDSATFCDECGAKLGEAAPTVSATAPPAQQPAGKTSCPSCGASVMPGEAFCDNCGAALDSPTLLYGQKPTPPPEPSPPPAPEQAAGPLICDNCGAQLEPGSNFCDMCGAKVSEALLASRSPVSEAPSPPVSEEPWPPVSEEPSPPPPTRPATPPVSEPAPPPQPEPSPAPEETYPAGPPAPEPAPAPQPQPPGPAYEQAYPAGPSVPGRLVVQGTNATLPFPPGKTEIVIGREDPISDIFPDIDLTDHGADEAGVSRQHARITVEGSQVLIEDLRSTNYTYVNRQKLTPGQPHPLSDGDEIRLGRLKLTFQR